MVKLFWLINFETRVLDKLEQIIGLTVKYGKNQENCNNLINEVETGLKEVASKA